MSDRMDDDPTTAKFLRGLTLGALLGAVVAGSSIWSRRAARRRAASRVGGPALEAPVVPEEPPSASPEPES